MVTSNVERIMEAWRGPSRTSAPLALKNGTRIIEIGADKNKGKGNVTSGEYSRKGLAPLECRKLTFSIG